MELREFIKNTLVDIVGGLEDAKKEFSQNGTDALINPTERSGNVSKREDNGYRKLQEVEFNVSVDIENSGSDKSGIGVITGLFSVGGTVSNEDSSKSATSVKFTVPISFPCQEPK